MQREGRPCDNKTLMTAHNIGPRVKGAPETIV